jgi:hypothetical protein
MVRKPFSTATLASAASASGGPFLARKRPAQSSPAPPQQRTSRRVTAVPSATEPEPGTSRGPSVSSEKRSIPQEPPSAWTHAPTALAREPPPSVTGPLALRWNVTLFTRS